MQVANEGDKAGPNDMESPLRLGLLNRAEGYKPNIAERLVGCLRYVSELQRALFAMQIVMQAAGAQSILKANERMLFDMHDHRILESHRRGTPIGALIDELARNGMVPMELRSEIDRYEFDYREWMQRIMHEARGTGDLRHFVVRLREEIGSRDMGFVGQELEHYLINYLEHMRHQVVHRFKPEDGEKGSKRLSS